METEYISLPAAIPSVQGCFEELRRGYDSTTMCPLEVQRTSSTYCLYVTPDSIC